MPTKDLLSNIDENIVMRLLRLYLQRVDSVSVVWILPYVYELSVVLLCKRGGLLRVEDKYCSGKFSGWTILLQARNVCSHNIYDSTRVKSNLNSVVHSNILYDVLSELGIETELYLQLHYSIVFLLRKENIYE